MESLEGAKRRAGICRIEAGAIIAKEKSISAVESGMAKLDVCARLLGGELPGVAQKIFKYDSQEPGIAGAFEALCNL